MDNDDDSSLSPTPNDFLLSIYKGNLSENMNEIKEDENLKLISSYKCSLCPKIHHNSLLTCSNCVNKGQFSSSKHDIYSNKRREILFNLLNINGYEEVQKYSTNKSIHISYFERLILLKKINSDKKILQSTFQNKYKSSIETRQIFDEIQIRKNRLILINHSIQQLKEQIEQKKQINIQTQQRIDDIRSRIEICKIDLDQVKQNLKSSNDEMQDRIELSIKHDKKLLNIRRERLNELITYIFPIQRVSANEDILATRIKALLNAQKTTLDDTNNEDLENNYGAIVPEYRYQIVNSFLPNNGDYQIDNLVSIYNVHTNINISDENINETDSPQLSPSCESYEILAGLSHACQLINVIAFYLHINLPFRLHQLEFNTDELTVDFLRSDIAKLNTNIISCCISQGIPIEFTNIIYTLENLLKLLTFNRYPTRPRPVIYSSQYIDMLEKEMTEISRVFITDYAYEDNNEENDEKDVADILNSYEWAKIPENDYILDDKSIYEESDSSLSTSTEQSSSVTSSTTDYLKTKSAVIINSIIRNFWS